MLKAAQEAGDTEKLKKYSALLYAQAQLIEGLPVDDPGRLRRGRLQPDAVIFPVFPGRRGAAPSPSA